jgi:hypothetical protein
LSTAKLFCDCKKYSLRYVSPHFKQFLARFFLARFVNKIENYFDVINVRQLKKVNNLNEKFVVFCEQMKKSEEKSRAVKKNLKNLFVGDERRSCRKHLKR